PMRMQGAYLRDAEIEAVVEFVRKQGKPHYHMEVTRSSEMAGANALTDEDMAYYEDAKRVIIRAQKGSIMLIQRQLKVSYPRAQRLMEQMERDSIVGPAEGPKARKVLVTYKDYYGEDAGDMAADDPDADGIDGGTDADGDAGDDDGNDRS
ncbi:MAG TPA: DNA translocase FtsK, partial [bacterium]|nr:DNA translocase FtsK [bacterium]